LIIAHEFLIIFFLNAIKSNDTMIETIAINKLMDALLKVIEE
jgi:hypothetical protein